MSTGQRLHRAVRRRALGVHRVPWALEAINGCANSELVRTDGETTCRPADPGVVEVAAILEAECSKLARGADGQNPCDRRPPEGANVGQIVVERCKPREDELTTPDGGAGGDVDPAKKDCPKADLEKFLNMALPAKDYTYIFNKIGGPGPPPGPTGATGPTGTPIR